MFSVYKDTLVPIKGRASDKKPKKNWNRPFHSDNAMEYALCSDHFMLGKKRQLGDSAEDGECLAFHTFKAKEEILFGYTAMDKNHPQTQETSL